jgi:hypothetical protein
LDDIPLIVSQEPPDRRSNVDLANLPTCSALKKTTLAKSRKRRLRNPLAFAPLHATWDRGKKTRLLRTLVAALSCAVERGLPCQPSSCSQAVVPNSLHTPAMKFPLRIRGPRGDSVCSANVVETREKDVGRLFHRSKRDTKSPEGRARN